MHQLKFTATATTTTKRDMTAKKKAQKSHKNLSEEEKKYQYDRDGYNNFLRRRWKTKINYRKI